MPQDHALLQQAVFIKFGSAGLEDHLPHRPAAYLKIIRRGGIFGRELRRNILYVRQPYVHNAVQLLNRLQRLVAAGVVHDGNGKSPGLGLLQGFQHPGQPLGGSDQIDVVGALLLQFQKDLGQALGVDGLAQALLADFIVLAVAALQAAAGKEHGAAAFAAADAGLLPVMQRRAGNHQLAGRTAHTGAPGPVRAAAAGAEGTGCGNLQDKTSRNRRAFRSA